MLPMIPTYLTTTVAVLALSAMQQWGTVREALMGQKNEGRVVIAEAATEGSFGLGALAGLKGEVIIIDGVGWISRPEERKGAARQTTGGEKATLLAVDTPTAWMSANLPANSDMAMLEQSIEAMVRELGLESSASRIFLIETKGAELDLHVINGVCARRADELPEDHRYRPSYFAQTVPATIVGIYAPDGAGVITHHDQRLHVHALTEGDAPVVGHVDGVRFPNGAVVRIAADPE